LFFSFKTIVLDDGLFKKNANFHYFFNHFFKKKNEIPPRNGLFKVQIQLRKKSAAYHMFSGENFLSQFADFVSIQLSSILQVSDSRFS